mgnify:CR=1 FL=1
MAIDAYNTGIQGQTTGAVMKMKSRSFQGRTWVFKGVHVSSSTFSTSHASPPVTRSSPSARSATPRPRTTWTTTAYSTSSADRPPPHAALGLAASCSRVLVSTGQVGLSRPWSLETPVGLMTRRPQPARSTSESETGRRSVPRAPVAWRNPGQGRFVSIRPRCERWCSRLGAIRDASYR